MIPLRLAATLGSAAAVLLGVHLFLNSVRNEARRECEQAHTQAALEAAQESQRLTRIAQEKSREVADDYRKKLAQVEADKRSRDADIVRLRIAIDEASSGAVGAGDPEGGPDPDGVRLAVIGRFLGEGVGLLEEARGSIKRLAEKTSALQAQVERVCVTQ